MIAHDFMQAMPVTDKITLEGFMESTNETGDKFNLFTFMQKNKLFCVSVFLFLLYIGFSVIYFSHLHTTIAFQEFQYGRILTALNKSDPSPNSIAEDLTGEESPQVVELLGLVNALKGENENLRVRNQSLQQESSDNAAANNAQQQIANMITQPQIESRFTYTSDRNAINGILNDVFGFEDVYGSGFSFELSPMNIDFTYNFTIVGIIRSAMWDEDHEIGIWSKSRYGSDVRSGEAILVSFNFNGKDGMDIVYRPYNKDIFSDDLITLSGFVRTLERCNYELMDEQ